MTVPRKRGRFLFREMNERGYDLPLGSVTKDGGVEFRSDLDISVWNPSEDVSGYKRVQPDDFVIGLRSFQSGIGHSAIEAIVSPAYTVLRPISTSVHPSFFRYLFKSSEYISRLENVAQGIRQGRTIAVADFYNIDCPVPPIEMQRAIADFLDSETARIDALIAKKQRTIDLLTNRRLSAIEGSLGSGRSSADFLKGSNSDTCQSVPLKRLLSNTIAGGTPDSDDEVYWTDDLSGTAWLAISDMVDCSTTTESSRRLSPAGLSASRLHLAPAGTLLFAMYASLGKLTVSAIPCVWNQAIIGLVPDSVKADGAYLALWLETLRPHLSLLARSTTQDNLNAEQVRSLPIPYRPIEEQRRLVRELGPVLRRLSEVGNMLAHQIELLREHRQALITAAVSGQIEIPGVAA